MLVRKIHARSLHAHDQHLLRHLHASPFSRCENRLQNSQFRTHAPAIERNLPLVVMIALLVLFAPTGIGSDGRCAHVSKRIGIERGDVPWMRRLPVNVGYIRYHSLA